MNQEVPSNYVSQLSVSRVTRASESARRNVKSTLTILPSAKLSQEVNWQAGLSTVRERNAVMFNNPLIADIHFNVGSGSNCQRIPAHKYVLSTGSSVFTAMFHGGLADKKDEIEIPDVEPGAFLNLLR